MHASLLSSFIHRMLILNRISGLNTLPLVQRRVTLASYSIARILEDKPLDQKVQVQGWIDSVRRHKTVTFLQISDRTNLFDKLQVVLNGEKVQNNGDAGIDCGSFINVSGKLVKSRGQKQALDLVAKDLQIVGPADSKVFPHARAQGMRDLVEMRQWPHMRPRSELFRAILSSRSKAINIVHSYFENNGYVLAHPPILTQNRCEEGSEAFQVESSNFSPPSTEAQEATVPLGFFGAPTYLTVSTQLHLEALCAGLGKVYTFGPTFRADHSLTRQHLAEFYMIEAEIPLVADLDGLCEIIENFVKSFVKSFQEKASKEIDLISGDTGDGAMKKIGEFIAKPFIKVPYSDASELVLQSKKTFSVPFKHGNDFTKEHELFLVEKIGSPVFLTHHPAALKPFYMRTNDDGSSALSVDLLLPNVAEVCGGSVREHDLAKIEGRLTPKQRETLEWYLDLRRTGTFPHAGFGIGFDRLLQFSLGLHNIRDTIAFPRFVGSCKY